MNFEANLNHFQFKIRKVFVWRVCIFSIYVLSQWVFRGYFQDIGVKLFSACKTKGVCIGIGIHTYYETLNEIMILIYGIS